jgi:hypothetical protein
MSAIISDCGQYRYRLTREVDPFEMRALLWIMLNPSTADASIDDPTIRRLKGFTKHWGCGSFSVVNAYALRSKSPKDLWRASDPVGPDNDTWIAGECKKYDTVVVAWGAHARPERISKLREILRASRQVMCLGVTASGAPKHPLYLPYETPLIEWLPEGKDEHLSTTGDKK